MSHDYQLILEILQLQQNDIYSVVERKQMHTNDYQRMQNKVQAYMALDLDMLDSAERYRVTNHFSRYLLNYLNQQMTEKAQKHGSKERIRIKNWHKGSIGYKNNLRNMISPVTKNILAACSQLAFDPENPALVNSKYDIFTKSYDEDKRITTWQLNDDSFVPEHPHILIMELAELSYPGIIILATEFESINGYGLQFSIAYRLLSNYVYDIALVIDHVLCLIYHQTSVLQTIIEEDITSDILVTYLQERRAQYIKEARSLARKYPRRQRITDLLNESNDLNNMDNFDAEHNENDENKLIEYYSHIEYFNLQSIFVDKTDKTDTSDKIDESDDVYQYIRNIQKQATELSRTKSSENHEEIVFINEYAGKVNFEMLVDEPLTFRYTADCIIAAEMSIYDKHTSGAIDLLLGHLEEDNRGNEALHLDFLLDRKAVSRFQLDFTLRSDKKKVVDYTVEPTLELIPWENEFRGLLHSSQTFARERKYRKQLQKYAKAIRQDYQGPRPALGIVYYDLSYSIEEIARQEAQLLVSLVESRNMYQGDRMVLSHPNLPAVRIALLEAM